MKLRLTVLITTDLAGRLEHLPLSASPERPIGEYLVDSNCYEALLKQSFEDGPLDAIMMTKLKTRGIITPEGLRHLCGRK